MITIKVSGLDKTDYFLGMVQARTHEAIKVALINTALAVRDAEQEEFRRVFDRPTKFTIGAIRVKARDSMTVAVGVVNMDGAFGRVANYLETQITGGSRKMKAMESALQHYSIMPRGWNAVPGEGAKLDAFGNMGPGQIRQILSWFSVAERWAGSTQNMTVETREKRRRGTKTKRGFEYFAVTPGRRQRGKLLPGIYMRTFFGFGSSIKPILIFVPTTHYKKRLDMEAVAGKTVDAVWQHKFDSAVARGLV